MVSAKKSFFDFFPVPEYLLFSAPGLALADDSVKLVQLSRGALARADKAPLDKLKEFASRHSLTHVRAALPDEKAYLFTATLDRVPAAGLKDAVAFILEENVPVALADAVFDFEIVSEDSSGIKATVSVVPKAVVNAHTELLESAGITPISFDIESQAIARAVISSGDARTTLIINLGQGKAGFYVAEDEVVQFSTTPAQGAVSPGSPLDIRDLKAEMRKVFAFWDTRVNSRGEPQKKIERALLCGAGAGNKALSEELMSECPVAYELADPWLNVSARGGASGMPFEEALEYASAIGAALPDAEKKYV